VDISCAFATSMATPEHVELAEQLGYHRAWLYDSPAVYPDVWMILGFCAERTSRIGLGPGVLVPSLRHPMVNAAAIATLAELAPGRVAVAVGAGFTGRRALGERPMRWNDVAGYVRVLRSLLRGEEAQWSGATLQMLQAPGFGASRPLDVPVLIAAGGPKGTAVAKELADGVFSAFTPHPEAASFIPWHALLSAGTVFAEGEDLTSPRVIAAIGPFAAVIYHAASARGSEAVDSLPGGRAWRESIEAVPEASRHLAVHAGHLVEPNERDRGHVQDLMELASRMSLTGSAGQVAAKLGALTSAGVTEVAYQPAGPDIPRELRAFASAAGLPVS
jgi:5,10-methylenetetrahydromethanopterin reductase